MAIRAVLFDFSGTLFRLEHEALDAHGDLMRALTAPVGVHEGLSPEMEDAWLRRDLDPELHRDVHVVALEAAGLTEPGAALAFYERLVSAAYWRAYPDTFQALRKVSEAGLRVAVLSNTGWDIRAVLRRYGVDHLVDEVVLSFEVGMIKPDPKIFLLACERLRVDPAEVLMVGDSEEADGGAEAVGSKVAIVEPLETAARPGALLAVLQKHGIIPV
ncbi:HAD family hydrolase [Umezawaea tangerina]|uniref:HAD superfamily hydrolase (TIGR01493 family)/HAD superfamily hydrolase (TIGR01509 family)/HAD superfamily hydrolase (TIGR01549 family) n=1 Tax=Umezawaea tangerina TaxID=84725 RepID=A0A2T0TKY3_9PSEU|nr:HAD-IA family hydrolase [Umezawaea tangerina]PRY46295.1 HAD superfamily hydrolase (TIGR01493 family)/HAD superfamily hydrolase (TIGR01509 family)/HAD superfamily hydrolase (TIGR01549 family) [Umezawaea tangerina]